MEGTRSTSHDAEVNDTAYLSLVPGLRECTGGRSPRPVFEDFPRAAQALPSGVHPVSPPGI